jgi:hypothetical protein
MATKAKAKVPVKKATGRPSTFTQATAATICERLAKGETVTAICASPGMPGYTTINRWIDKDETFRRDYARARELGLHAMAEQCLQISDRQSPSTDSGATDTGDVQHRRLQVDTRKWLLARLLPKVYGDKQQLEHSGSVDIAASLTAARARSGLK